MQLYFVTAAASWMPPDLLFMDLVAGEEFQISHVRPGQLPALLSQVLEGRVLARRGCEKAAQGKLLQGFCGTNLSDILM